MDRTSWYRTRAQIIAATWLTVVVANGRNAEGVSFKNIFALMCRRENNTLLFLPDSFLVASIPQCLQSA